MPLAASDVVGVMTQSGPPHDLVSTVTVAKTADPNNNFYLDCLVARLNIGNLRGKVLQYRNTVSWTLTPVMVSISVSLDIPGKYASNSNDPTLVDYETMKQYYSDFNNSGLATMGTTVPTLWVISHEFRWVKIVTTGGKNSATFDSFTLSIRN